MELHEKDPWRKVRSWTRLRKAMWWVNLMLVLVLCSKLYINFFPGNTAQNYSDDKNGKKKVISRIGLNMREYPSKSAPVLGAIPTNAYVSVMPIDSTYEYDSAHWTRIEHKGQTGWVYSKYLE